MRRFLAIMALFLCAVASAITQTSFPSVSGETLAGQSLTLPDAASGRPAILCIGFSHASQPTIAKWAETVRKELPSVADSVYIVAVLQDAPRFVRGMAVRGMRSKTSPETRDHFLVIYSGEERVKQAVRFTDSSSTYITLLDNTGRIQWLHSGEVSPTALQTLRDKLTGLNVPAAIR